MTPRRGWAAVYCRLSKEDDEKPGAAAESESIRNQRELLLNWAAQHGYRVSQIYIDEDYSGADRRRPGFNAMLEAARRGEFEVILAKTQSRFTRDMELVEKYLHGLFPEWGVRFIAVVDHVDTQDPAGKKARQINGLVNEWYLEDLSASVRAVLDHKRRSGVYVAAQALYGYRKAPQDHGRLVIDPAAAEIVRRVFALYLRGYGVSKIAQMLNQDGIAPPSVYRGRGKAGKTVLWSKATVRRILSNRTYAGDLEQGRVRRISYKSSRTRRLPQEDWIVVPNTHEGIVSREDFAKVQQLLQAHAHGSGRGEAVHPLAGLVHCGICGGKMEQTGPTGRRYLRCRTAQRSHAVCPGQPYMPLVELERLVFQQVRQYTDRKPDRTLLRRLLQEVVICPPGDGGRTIELHWNF